MQIQSKDKKDDGTGTGLPAIDWMAGEVGKLMDEVLADLKPSARSAYTVPSAPDTQKFLAMVSGMVEIDLNVTIPNGFGGARRYDRFLKIGSAIQWQIRERSYAGFREQFKVRTAQDIGKLGACVKCEEGMFYVEFISGTSWGGIGFRTDRSV